MTASIRKKSPKGCAAPTATCRSGWRSTPGRSDPATPSPERGRRHLAGEVVADHALGPQELQRALLDLPLAAHLLVVLVVDAVPDHRIGARVRLVRDVVQVGAADGVGRAGH